MNNRPGMNRREVLAAICSMRRLRDTSRRDGGIFGRGMAAGYQHAALILWRDYKEANS